MVNAGSCRLWKNSLEEEGALQSWAFAHAGLLCHTINIKRSTLPRCALLASRACSAVRLQVLLPEQDEAAQVACSGLVQSMLEKNKAAGGRGQQPGLSP